MDRIKIIIGLLSVAVLSSCSIKESFAPTPDPVLEDSFYASLEQPVVAASTKGYALVNTNDAGKKVYKIYWNAGDHVSRFSGKNLNREYAFQGKDGDTAGSFARVGTDPEEFFEETIETGFRYAIYPYDPDNGCDPDGTLKVVISDKQNYYPVDNDIKVGVQPLMVAKAASGEAYMFKHIGSYVGVSLKGDGVKVSSISIKSNAGEIISGRFAFEFDEDGYIPKPATRPDFPQGTDKVEMTFGDSPVELNAENPKVFWFNLPSITFKEGFKVTVTAANGRSQEINASSITLGRTLFYTIPYTIDLPSISVEGVTLNESTLSLIAGGETFTLVATVVPADATDKSVTWTSSDEAVATVSENGLVSAIAPGTVTITATSVADNTKTATCIVTVTPGVVAVESVSLNKTELSLIVGAEETLTATVLPGNADNKAVTWSSSDTAVATVDANGKVKAIAIGEAVITVTTNDGGKTAACGVTVTKKPNQPGDPISGEEEDD